MVPVNVYKPRYKIAFQAKSKIWPYKNSRLRRFFNIRGRKLVRRGLFKRYFVVFNNMKWTVARRYIRPFMKKRSNVRRRFRNVFYSKQQLRAFYGKQKEEAFRNFFKKFLGGAKGRNNMFAVALERRADMFLFRLRFLPTIYACHQFVHHFGVNINGKQETSPSALIRPGDIVTFNKGHWRPFFEYLLERLYWRVCGLDDWKRRQFKALRKKVWWCYRNKFFKRSNVTVLRKINFIIRKLLKVNRSYKKYLPKFHKEVIEAELFWKPYQSVDKVSEFDAIKKELVFVWNDYRLKIGLLIKKLTRLSKKKWRLKLWSWRRYYAHYFTLMTYIFHFYKLLKFYSTKFKALELFFYKEQMLLKSKYTVTSEVTDYKNLRITIVENIKAKRLERSSLEEKIENLQKNIKLIKQKISFFQKKQKYLFNLGVINKNQRFFSVKGKNHLKILFLSLIKKAQNKISKNEKDIKKTEFKLTHVKAQILSLFQQHFQEKKTSTWVLSNRIEEKLDTIAKFKFGFNSKMKLIEERSDLFNQNLEFLLNFILKRRVKRYSLKRKPFIDSKTKKEVKRKSPIVYFLAKRLRQKRRKLMLPRLKKVHWYVPSYIYFDYCTLQAVFLYNPKPEEIVYSFRCSLRRIHSFYRALGL